MKLFRTIAEPEEIELLRADAIPASEAPMAEDEDPASLEELDLSVRQPARRARWPELVIGLILLLGIVGWGAFDWWKSQDQLTNYRAAQTAAAARHWEEAQARYSAAGAYADAADRANEAAGYITERDEQYTLAAIAAERGDWLAALGAVRVVEQIQPGYRDSNSILARAEPQVYRGALGGAIVHRPKANPPGLYVYGDNGWIWLEGSDTNSVVRTGFSSQPGTFIYDVSDTEGSTQSNRAAQTDTADNGYSLAGRSLVAATLENGAYHYDSISIDALEYTPIRWGKLGGWGSTDIGCSEDLAIHLTPNNQTCQRIVYQGAGDATVRSLTLPAENWSVAAFADDSSRVLLVEQTGVPMMYLNSAIYIADPDGGNRKLLYSQAGSIKAASFSADSRYALVTITNSYDYGNDSKEIILLDTNSSVESVRLSMVVNASQSPTNETTATFLRGSRAGQVLVMTASMRTTRISLFDVTGTAPQPLLDVDRAAVFGAWAMTDEDGGLLLAFVGSESSELSDIFYVDSANNPTRINLPSNPGERKLFAWIRQGRLIFYIAPNSSTNNSPSIIFRLQTTDLKAALAGTAMSQDIYRRPAGDINWASFALGPKTGAYVDSEGLHTISYDGSASLLLSPDIDDITDPQLIESYALLY